MCKELPVIPVNKVVDPKRIIGKNLVSRRRRGTRSKPKKLLQRVLFREPAYEGSFIKGFHAYGKN
jgi:hypothetical protein